MAALPESRVTPSKPFSHTGVDFAGPFVVKSGNPRKPRLTKGYLCIFVCFSTKCVHLEFASELTTQCFLAALDRFVARRSLPSDIYSDQGRNFLGASRLLNEISIFLEENRENISDYLSLKSVQWHFNCAYAPWFGGLWEAGVKSAKSLLKRMFKESSYSVEDYFTIFARIEAVLNSRPLCDLPADPSEASSYLTPGHFLTGTPLTSLPERYPPCEQPVRDRWLNLRRLVQSFWKRWSKEYLNTLIQRNKWKSPAATPEVGDVVLVKGDQTPPLSWPIGRIIRLHMSADGIPRVADLKLADQQVVTRAVARLLPLRGSIE
ncbi:uncharacterized protein LOC123302099 [Chrysoperla carnea]|uniref:uncharacterized protein LOC123302099 n=1 Tax=Chrysoperla carnea TaxID=189513 RepID=UPI001D066AA0|nr:uncharacterized protein LOC123302099 [Chrysoperla carnea]